MPTVIVTTSFRVYPGETLTFTNENAFSLEGGSSGSPTLLIEGVVNATMSSSGSGYNSITGIAIGYGGFYDSAVTITESGSLTVTNNATGGYAYGYSSGSWSPDFYNRGSVQVTAKGTAYGLSTWDAGPWVFENSGTFRVTSTASDARGVNLANGGTFRNTGVFEVTGATNVVGVGLNGWDSSFSNSGTIKATDGSAASDSIAVYWTSSFGSGDTFVNNGWVEGDYALKVSPYSSYTSGTEVFTNNGTFLGKVDMGFSSARLVNAGVIWGDTSLGLGDDTYSGASGIFVGRMTGGDGADSIAGGERGEQFLGEAGNDTISGGAGDDTVNGGRDFDLLDGGAGFDVLDYSDATMGVTASFATGRAFASGEDTISGFEKIIGGIYGDTLSGSAGADNLMAGGGDDSLQGGDGRDYLRGEAGADYIVGGAAFDDIHGNQGDDTASGGDGDDWVVGGQDNDRLSGDLGDDIVYGNLGNDVLDGGAGADIVRGGQGDDVLAGGEGNDWLSGDRGDDNLTGGAGADIFHSFVDAGIDLVTDFNFAEGDRVQLDPGTAYTLAQVGADTVIDMGGGNRVVLVNVQLSALPEGWIVGG
ncbi:calcium-binding protein [Phenylobacterium sp.]|uniref:calcium-binding protein n=1 Tax=Phenylobacterium sp. TaxID=1871053 RepID=UPI002FE0E983